MYKSSQFKDSVWHGFIFWVGRLAEIGKYRLTCVMDCWEESDPVGIIPAVCFSV